MTTLDEIRTTFGRAVEATCVDGLYAKSPTCGDGNQTAATMLADLTDDDVTSVDVTALTGHGYTHFIHVATVGGNVNFMSDATFE